MQGGSGYRSGAFALAALALGGGATLAAAQPAAALVATPQAAAGQWDIALADGTRQCRLTLRLEPAGSGHMLAMPAGCRRALPILGEVDAWNVPEADRLDLSDASGLPVLDFTASGSGLAATGPNGESYRLSAIGARGATTPGFAPVQVAATTRPAAAPPIHPGDVAGRYEVLRESGRDTGCMVTLDDSTRVPGGYRAALAPACRDQGIVIFDPTAWQIVNGRMVLTAKRGHTTKLDRQPNGLWSKEPGEGKALSLKKM